MIIGVEKGIDMSSSRSGHPCYTHVALMPLIKACTHFFHSGNRLNINVVCAV